MIVFDWLYVVAAVSLAVYGFNSLVLLALYWRTRKRTVACPPLHETPHVTVQLPVYNERHVVERLIDAAAALDYPRDYGMLPAVRDAVRRHVMNV